MRVFGLFIGCCASMLLPLRVSAQAELDAQQEAEKQPKFAPVLPTLAITANSTGNAAFLVGIDVYRGLKKISPDLRLTFTAQTETANGSATLLTINPDASSTVTGLNTWFVAGAVTFDWISKDKPLQSELVALQAAWQEAYQICLEHCEDRGATDNCDEFNEEKEHTDGGEYLDKGAMCSPGKEAYLRAEEAYASAQRDANSKRRARSGLAYPVGELSIGGKFGRQLFRYIDTSDPANLSEQERGEWTLLPAIYGYYMGEIGTREDGKERGIDSGLEGWLAYEQRHVPSSDTAEICESPGMVGMGEVSVCRDRALGAPARVRVAGLTLGWTGVEPKRATWRFSTLGQGSVTAEGNVALGVRFPLSFDLSRLKDSYEGPFRGLLQLEPFLQFGVGAGNDQFDNVSFVVMLSVRGDRSIFPTAATLFQ